MTNKINKKRWRAINATPTRHCNNDLEPRRTVNKNKTVHKAEHGQDTNLIKHERIDTLINRPTKLKVALIQEKNSIPQITEQQNS
jgi:hypothetical protein